MTGAVGELVPQFGWVRASVEYQEASGMCSGIRFGCVGCFRQSQHQPGRPRAEASIVLARVGGRQRNVTVKAEGGEFRLVKPPRPHPGLIGFSTSDPHQPPVSASPRAEA